MQQDDPQQYIVIVVKGRLENSLKLWLFYPQHTSRVVEVPKCSEQLN